MGLELDLVYTQPALDFKHLRDHDGDDDASLNFFYLNLQEFEVKAYCLIQLRQQQISKELAP